MGEESWQQQPEAATVRKRDDSRSLTVSIQSKEAARGVVSATMKATHSTSINQVTPHRVAFRL